MSSKTPVGYIEIRVFAHATEDNDKVLTAARNILPQELIDKTKFEEANLAGHHGNPIVVYEAKIKDKEMVQAVFAGLCSRLNILDKELLGDEVDRHLEKGNLYVRFDKQSAFLNELKLGTVDTIRLRIHFKKHDKREVEEICRQCGLLP